MDWVGFFKQVFRNTLTEAQGNWETIANDKELGLHGKIFLEEGRGKTKKEDKKIPNAVHLVRRSDYLLSELRKALEKDFIAKEQMDAAGPPQGAAAQGSRAALAEKPSRASPVKKERDSVFDSDDGSESMDESAMKENMRPVRKQLKSLKNQVDTLKGAEKLKLLKECLHSVGTRIDELMNESSDKERTRKHAWQFVTLFWPKEVKYTQLIEIYKKLLGQTGGPSTGGVKRQPSVESNEQESKKQKM